LDSRPLTPHLPPRRSPGTKSALLVNAIAGYAETPGELAA
jgi:hypothetical protein